MSAPRKDLSRTRIENLKVLLVQWGGPTVLARKLQYSGPSYLSQLLSGNRPFTEKTARMIEASLDLPSLWLDRAHNMTTDIDPELLSAVVSQVSAALPPKGIVAPRQVSEVIALVYENAKATGQVDEEYIKRLMKLLDK